MACIGLSYLPATIAGAVMWANLVFSELPSAFCLIFRLRLSVSTESSARGNTTVECNRVKQRLSKNLTHWPHFQKLCQLWRLSTLVRSLYSLICLLNPRILLFMPKTAILIIVPAGSTLALKYFWALQAQNYQRRSNHQHQCVCLYLWMQYPLHYTALRAPNFPYGVVRRRLIFSWRFWNFSRWRKYLGGPIFSRRCQGIRRCMRRFLWSYCFLWRLPQPLWWPRNFHDRRKWCLNPMKIRTDQCLKNMRAREKR